jgi:SAM-dependent methyltransferase
MQFPDLPREAYHFARRSLRSLAPGLAYKYYLFKKSRDPNAGRSPEAIFSDIYTRNLWGGRSGEFNSGRGSDDKELFASIVNKFVDEYAIRSIVDLGCGDFRIGQQIARPSIKYVGVDVVPALVERNQALFASEHISFERRDLITDGLPTGDLCVIRQVLQHLSNDQIRTILPKLLAFRYALLAEHHPAPRKFRKANLDKPAGADTRIVFGSGVFLDRPPFSLPNVRVLAQISLPPFLYPGEHLTVYMLGSGGRPPAPCAASPHCPQSTPECQ